MARQIVVEIVGDAGRFNSATSDAITHSDTLTGKLQGIGKGMVIGAGIGAFNLLSDAISVGISKLGEAHEAFLQDEAGQKLLAQALQNNIPNWDGNAAGAEAFASAQARLGFADDDVRASLGQLVGVTHDLGEAQQLSSLAMDLARAKGIDLATATDIVTKAHEGNGRALKGLGIDIDGVTTSAGFLDAIQQNVNGSAETWAATNEGKVAVSNVKVGEAMEKVGGIVDKVAQVAVPFLADALTFLADTLGQVWDAIQPVVSAIAEALQPVIERVGPTAKTVFDGIKTVVQALAPVFQSVFGTIGSIIGTAQGVFQGLLGTAQSVTGGIMGAFQGVWYVISAVMSAILGAVRGAINGVIGAINGIIGAIDSIQVHIHLNLPDPLPDINFDWYGLNIGRLPYLHKGGIVPGPAGSDQLAILQAGELVTPAGAVPGGGGLTINFNSVWPPTAAQAREVARLIDRELYYNARSRTKLLPD